MAVVSEKAQRTVQARAGLRRVDHGQRLRQHRLIRRTWCSPNKNGAFALVMVPMEKPRRQTAQAAQ